MPVQRVSAPRALLAAMAAAALVACGDDDPGAVPPLPTGGGQGATGGTASGGSGGAPVGGGGGEGAYLGDIPVVEEPDTECAVAAAAPIPLLPAGSDAGLGRLERVGSRWAAWGGAGFVTFDDDGTNLSPLTGLTEDAAVAAGSEGSTLLIAGVDDEVLPPQMLAARHDELGAPLLAPIPLGNAFSFNGVVAANATGSLVAWVSDGNPEAGEPSGLVASFVDPAGVPSAPFELTQRGIAFDFDPTAVATTTGFTLAWSIGDIDMSESYFLKATSTGPVGGVVPIALSEGRHRIVRMVATADGYAALLQGGVPFEAAFVVFLDADGAVVPPAHQYLGAKRGIDLAVHDSGQLALIALRDGDGELPALRPLDPAGVPTGPWVCFDGTTERVGIAADGSGWALVRELVDQSVELLRVDLAGTGPG